MLIDGTSPYRRKQVELCAFAVHIDEVQIAREVEIMTTKDYIDTKGYWISPDRTIRRMGRRGWRATNHCEGDGRVLRRRVESNLRCVEGQSI
jgi:hypothetical protein